MFESNALGSAGGRGACGNQVADLIKPLFAVGNPKVIREEPHHFLLLHINCKELLDHALFFIGYRQHAAAA